MGIKEEKAALAALSPVHDVLADEVLKEFRLARRPVEPVT
jgi:hypothetical protein